MSRHVTFAKLICDKVLLVFSQLECEMKYYRGIKEDLFNDINNYIFFLLIQIVIVILKNVLACITTHTIQFIISL